VWLASDWRQLPFDQRLVAARKLRVLARALPADKEELVAILQSVRLVVAVTGDGVNDAPALQRADVGVAMGLRGTDIAKQASDIVLLDDNFRSLVRAVHWGRALFDNIQKFIQFQLTINLSALAIVFFGTLFGLTGEPGEPPLTVIQLLWINLIMDTFAVIALCLEPPAPEQMRRPPKGRTAPFITRSMWTSILTMSTFFTVVILALTTWLRHDGIYSLTDSATVFAVYVLLQVFNEINARSLQPKQSPLHGLLKNRAFIGVLTLIVVVQVIMTEIGGKIGAEVFRTAPLSFETWVLVVLGSSSALIFGEIVRLIRRQVAQNRPVSAA
jgi:Ca2+-transporting ATPase